MKTRDEEKIANILLDDSIRSVRPTVSFKEAIYLICSQFSSYCPHSLYNNYKDNEEVVIDKWNLKFSVINGDVDLSTLMSGIIKQKSIEVSMEAVNKNNKELKNKIDDVLYFIGIH